MDPGSTKKEKFLAYNTLVSLVMAMKGRQVTVDLRNGASVTGKIVRCDAYMNVDMAHVLFRDASEKPHIFENFFINKRNIRYVHIPPQVNMKKAVEKFVESCQMKDPQIQRQPFKMSRLKRRQAETLEHVRMLKEKELSKIKTESTDEGLEKE